MSEQTSDVWKLLMRNEPRCSTAQFLPDMEPLLKCTETPLVTGAVAYVRSLII
jgi:hypothetical protein